MSTERIKIFGIDSHFKIIHILGKSEIFQL